MDDSKKPPTKAEKLKMFKDGFWSAKVPPVCHRNWDNESWIKWIDVEGIWLTRKWREDKNG